MSVKTSQVRVTDELILREVNYQGAFQLAKLLQQSVYTPDFFTVEKTADQGDGEFDTEMEYYDFHAVAVEIRKAREETCSHLCVQAHYVLDGGKGEASVTLLLDD